ncbi:hypothetical protein [Streptomyces sulphureus]|uniref:hypothetical protein n=1 Tax=Streptomyces sulphureus TaxID=47758 RepID=UPI00035CD256|nr:hypothetical protein [Streptomyces sulphureus]
MPATIEATDLDALIEDLDARITETDLTEGGGGDSSGCSGVCTIVVCTVIVC